MLSRKIKNKMGGYPPKGCITDPRNTKMEMSWEYRRMGVPFEGGQGPDGAATPYMDFPTHTFKACRGEYNNSSTHFLTLALHGGVWSASNRSCFTPQEMTWTYRKDKISCSQMRFKAWTVQSIA